jgi:hypothetical protein
MYCRRDWMRAVAFNIAEGWSRDDTEDIAGAPEGKRTGNYRHGGRSKETIELWKRIKSLC